MNNKHMCCSVRLFLNVLSCKDSVIEILYRKMITIHWNNSIITYIPCSFILGRSLSNTAILPLFTTRWRSVVYGGPGSAPSNRYGWLQHFLSCMRTFSRRILSILPAEFRMSMSFISIFVYLMGRDMSQYYTLVYNISIQVISSCVEQRGLPLSLHLAQAHIHLDLFFGKQGLLYVSFYTTKQERTQNLQEKNCRSKERFNTNKSNAT